MTKLHVDIQDDEGVVSKHGWADPDTAHVFCLSEGPDADAVRQIHQRAGHPRTRSMRSPSPPGIRADTEGADRWT